MELLEEDNSSYSTCPALLTRPREELAPSHPRPVAWESHIPPYTVEHPQLTLLEWTFLWVAWAVIFYSFQVQGCLESSSPVFWKNALTSRLLYKQYNGGSFRYKGYLLSPLLSMYVHKQISWDDGKLHSGTELHLNAFRIWLLLRPTPSPAIREAKFLHALDLLYRTTC